MCGRRAREGGRVKVLLTGHHGYIGSVVAPVLGAAGHDVTGLDVFFYRGCDLLPDGKLIDSVTLDVRDTEPAHLKGYDAVVHLAALSNDPLGDLSPTLTADINYHGTLAVARAAKTVGVNRFVFSSSCSMYGAPSRDDLVGEEAALKPLTAYAESKVRSEESLAELADGSFSPVFMRNATAYGVSNRLRMDLVLNNLTAWAFTTGRIRIVSDGTPWRPLVHVEDIAHAIAAVLEAPTELTHNEAFNVGFASENYQIRDLAEIVRERLPESSIEYAEDGDSDRRSYRVNFSKFARAFPDFPQRWDARRGVDQLVEAYARVGLTLDDFVGPRYTRLKRLRELMAAGSLDDKLRWSPVEAA